MDPALEIRKLPPSIVRELSQILDYADSWKRLMAIIPKKLVRSEYICDINPTNLPKYNSEDFKIIEREKINFKRSCTEILFDEWGTSGRPRASLGHLKFFLTKAELYRAADYLAKLLHEELPPRPTHGPAAFVELSQPLCIDRHLLNEKPQIEETSNTNNIPITIRSQENKLIPKVIPKIVVSEESNTNNNKLKENTDLSDMIKFSKSEITGESVLSDIVPEFSVLLQQDTVEDSVSKDFVNNTNEEFTPAFSQILGDLPNQDQSKSSIPHFSQLLTDNSPIEGDTRGDSVSNSNFIPDLSALNQNLENSGTSIIPNFEMLQSSGVLNSNLSLSICPTTESNITSSSLPKCPSPLPTLSLNTELPHFTYAELKTATNSFSETPFTSQKENGRFLGSGAFGSVFLALGLLDEPLAVKKIFLENVEVVHENDEVTKQFKNEVEILSKYKHENLVSLKGYSCDGCTYCLVYEYVPGGALFDTLEKQPQKLSWKQRINIAFGTAKAVAYLHTGFSSPLIHRDIKSANILLDASYNPKLCDFGIVKLLPNQKTHTQTTLYGTSAYMSPEYHRGDISIKLDTFSFGVVLLELLTSLPPFDYNRQGADLVTYVEDKCEESIDALLDKTVGSWKMDDKNFAEELFGLTLKCLDDKKKRPMMVDVVNALDQIIKNIN